MDHVCDCGHTHHVVTPEQLESLDITDIITQVEEHVFQEHRHTGHRPEAIVVSGELAQRIRAAFLEWPGLKRPVGHIEHRRPAACCKFKGVIHLGELAGVKIYEYLGSRKRFEAISLDITAPTV